MPHVSSPVEPDLKAKILALLDENRAMTVATLRPDGWPQATMVGFVNEDLTLYFAVARVSQKLANIERDPRISIALGHNADRLRGLSMAALAEEVTDLAEIETLEAFMRQRYPRQDRFSPRENSSALLRARPSFISVIDLAHGPGEPELALMGGDDAIHRVNNAARGGHKSDRTDVGDRSVLVQVRHAGADVYRPGAPF